jgi:NhaP-type Na+/H+ or K+/H+ antiporter
MENPALEIAVILLAAVGAQLLAAQLSIPAIVPLLIVGVAFGPYAAGVIDPDELLGDLLDPIVALAVGAILFDGSLSLHRKQLEHGVGGVVLRLTTLGVAITWGIAGAGAALILGLDHRIALILGAVLTLSGPTVVIPLLDFVRAKPRPDAVLRWEGILIDPIGAILAVLVFHAVVSGDGSFDVGEFAATVGIGLGTGLVGAGLLSFLLRERRFDAALEASATLALVLASVALASELREDAGLVTAIVMGVMMAHRQHEIVERAPAFSEILVNLLLGTLFVILSARVDPDLVLDLGVEGLAFVALLMVLARPLGVLVSTARSSLTREERTLVGWMMPRGIVAAATVSSFESDLIHAGVPDAELLVPVTFLVIAATVVIYGLTARPLALRLGVAEPGDRSLPP